MSETFLICQYAHDTFFHRLSSICPSSVWMFSSWMKQGFLEICSGHSFLHSELILRNLVASMTMLEWSWKDVEHEARVLHTHFLQSFTLCSTSVDCHSTIFYVFFINIRHMMKFSGVVKPSNFVIPWIMPELSEFPVWAWLFLFETLLMIWYLFWTSWHRCEICLSETLHKS